jgi:hypothetical protein
MITQYILHIFQHSVRVCMRGLGPLSLVSTTEELLERKSSSSGLENREYCHRDPLCWPCDTLYLQKLALSSLTSDGRSQTKTMELYSYVCERGREYLGGRLSPSYNQQTSGTQQSFS